ncbi:unannotated protein [freshwater metagenome]|uniref:Unannotated protein n=1 Tax=freshwater metagenome TaxID=449393 RepID=A0A6J6PXZ0_9ZZZZ
MAGISALVNPKEKVLVVTEVIVNSPWKGSVTPVMNTC